MLLRVRILYQESDIVMIMTYGCQNVLKWRNVTLMAGTFGRSQGAESTAGLGGGKMTRFWGSKIAISIEDGWFQERERLKEEAAKVPTNRSPTG